MKKILAAVLAILLTKDALAVPIISATSASSITNGTTMAVSGSGLPVKDGKPHLWADAQGGSVAPHSSLSDTTVFRTENATYDTSSAKRWGVGVFKSNWAYGSATSSQRAYTIRPDVLSMFYGTKIILSWWEKTDITSFTPSNWKVGVRWWYNSTAGGYPSHYFTSLGAGSDGPEDLRFNNENPTASTGIGAGLGFTDSTWRRVTALYRMNSGLGVADGTVLIYKNNTLVKTVSSWQFNNASFPDFARYVFYQAVIANDAIPSGTSFWFSDLFADYGWGRYEIGNASTYAACTQLEIQPYTAATANNATLSIRVGTITGGKWLYACDDNNVCNSSGYALEAGGSAAPTINTVSPQNGPPAGGTTVTLGGVDFGNPFQVTVGGVDATDETFTSSFLVSFKTPPGVAESINDITITNLSDSQSGTYFNGFTYDPAEATINPVTEVFPWIVP